MKMKMDEVTGVVAVTRRVFTRHPLAAIAAGTGAAPARSSSAVRRGLRCPSCGQFRVTISPVNVSRCTQVGGLWKTSLSCGNERCRFTELSTKTLAELVTA